MVQVPSTSAQLPWSFSLVLYFCFILAGATSNLVSLTTGNVNQDYQGTIVLRITDVFGDYEEVRFSVIVSVLHTMLIIFFSLNNVWVSARYFGIITSASSDGFGVSLPRAGQTRKRRCCLHIHDMDVDKGSDQI